MAAQLLLKALVLRMLVGVSATATCYWPSGDEASGQVPCQDSDTTWCCDEESVCLENGLCQSLHQPYVLSRGGCTDDTWASSSCPPACADVATSGGCSIVLYSNVNNVVEYCCNSITITDDNSTGCLSGDPFKVSTGDFIVGKAALSGLSSSTTSSSSTGTATATSTTSTAASTTSAAAESATATANCTADSSSGNNNTVAVGAGVGVSLGALAIAGFSWAFWERRQRTKGAALPPGYPSPGPNAHADMYKYGNPAVPQSANQPVRYEVSSTNYQPAYELN